MEASEIKLVVIREGHASSATCLLDAVCREARYVPIDIASFILRAEKVGLHSICARVGRIDTH